MSPSTSPSQCQDTSYNECDCKQYEEVEIPHENPDNLVCYHCNLSPKECKCLDEPEQYHFIKKENTV